MQLRIDELAQQARTTSRNVRAYQARGLLPPPHVVGRTGYYDEEHLRRLELIGELQERGFSLEAIRHTLDAWSRGGSLAQLLGFRHILTAPLSDEEPVIYPLAELVERFPEAADQPDLVARAEALHLITPVGEDRFEAPSPMLIEAGAELARAGVPLAAILDLVEGVRGDAARIAERFVALTREHLLDPITAGPADADAVQRALDSLTRLRPVAVEVVRPFLAQALHEEIERSVREEGERAALAEDPPAS